MISTIWIIYQFLRTIAITTSCEILNQETEKTYIVVNKILANCNSSNLTKEDVFEFDRFSRMLLNRNLKIKSGFIFVDYSFAYKMIEILLSYSFILKELQ